MVEAGRDARDGLPLDAGGRAGDWPVRPGEHVSRYEVLDKVGQGGMGIVFRARDALLGREVALKFPWPRADPVVHDRFLREARAASRLSHPNVVRIFDFGKWRGLPWMVMELVDGCSLRLLMTGKAWEIPTVLEDAAGLAKALREAHAIGIIHRDVNPNNILIRQKDGWALLMDFGLAADPSAHTVSEPLTGQGRVIGTTGYMSPEQVLGKNLDPRTDIFSLGAVLYEMCTGERAFEGKNPGDANDAILHLAVPPPSAINPEVPADLERVILKALAKDPVRRHRDASELVSEIAAVQGRLISAEFASSSPASSATPRIAAWAGGLAVAIFAAVAATRLPSHPPPQKAGFPAGSPLQVTRDPGCEAEPAISPDGSLIAYTSIGPDTSDIWITDPAGASRVRLTDDAAKDRSPAWFPDGSALAFVSDRGGEDAIWKMPRLGGSAVLVVPQAVDPAPSPDARRIAFARRNAAGYYRIAVSATEAPSATTWITGDEDGQLNHVQPAWSPDGTMICYADAANLWVVHLDGGRPRRLTADNAGDFEPVWSSDGRHVVFSSYREGTQALWRVAAEGGAPERLTIGTGPESEASVSRDGSRVAYSTYLNDYDIVIVDRRTRESHLIASRLYESAPTFAPGGTAVAYAAFRPGGRMDVWQQPLVAGRPIGAPRQLTDLRGTVNTPAYSSDGRWVAFKREFEGRLAIWVTGASGGMPEPFTEGGAPARHPAWSPDGKALAYVVESGAQAHVWVAPIRDGRPAGSPRQLTSGDTTDQAPVWSADGRTIAYLSQGEREDEIRFVPAAGGASRRIARRVGVGRLRWEKETGWLWFSALSARGVAQLWKVSPDGGEPVSAGDPGLFAEAASAGDFELSSDGRLLAYTRQQTRGDVWLVERASID